MAVELDVAITKPDANVKPATGSCVQVLRDGGQPVGVLHREQEHSGADPETLGDRKNRSRCGQQRRAVSVVEEVVLREPELVVSELFHQRGVLTHLSVCSGPVGRLHGCVLEAEEADSEAHRNLRATWRRQLVDGPPRRRP
jgi:hypothetical protein